jgi:hypothetical protein
MKSPSLTLCLSLLLSLSFVSAEEEKEKSKKKDYPKGEGHEWLVFPPQGEVKKKKILLLSGDDEYRSEELMPQLGKLLAEQHGFHTTVTFSLNPDDGTVDPSNHTHLPGLGNIDSADLIIMLWRFREPSKKDCERLAKYLKAGKPIIALRTSTHPFAFDVDRDSPFVKWDWQSKEPGWVGGFGETVFGETWVDHWGEHAVQGTKAILEPSAKDHPIVQGVGTITGDSDVYETAPPADATILYRGQVLTTLDGNSAPASGPRKEQQINDPMMPLIWLRDYKNEFGTTNQILLSTIGSATDFKNKPLRHLIINATYHFLKLPIPSNPSVEFTPDYNPTMYGFNTFLKNKSPKDYLATPSK